MERMQVYLMSVMITKETMQDLENIISEFFNKMNIEPLVPVDIFKLATDLGFDVRGAEFEDSLDGIIVVNEYDEKIEGFESNKVIAYNCRKSIDDKKFIVAHELAHYIYKKMTQNTAKIVVAYRDHKEEYSGNEFEQKMDYIAASLLVPKKHLENNEKVETDKDIADYYNVPLSLAQRRYEEVRGG